MTKRYHQKPAAVPGIDDTCKERRCLLCTGKFMSAWSGERVCRKCKNRSVWREGVRWPSGDLPF